MSFIAQLFEEAEKSFLGYGIHENVSPINVDGSAKKNRDGSVKNSLFALTFATVDESNSILEEREFNIMTFKHDMKVDYMQDMVVADYLRLGSILTCFYPVEKLEEYFNPWAAVGISDKANITSILTKKANMDVFNATVKELFMAAATPLVGVASGYRFRLKVVYTKNGYLDLPNNRYIEPASVPLELSKIALTVKDQEYYIAATTPKKPDTLAPSGPGAAGGMPTPPVMPSSVPPVMAAPVSPFAGVAAPNAPAPTNGLPGAPFTAAPNQAQVTAPAGNNPLGNIPSLG